jgi:hypothetical protein
MRGVRCQCGNEKWVVAVGGSSLNLTCPECRRKYHLALLSTDYRFTEIPVPYGPPILLEP